MDANRRGPRRLVCKHRGVWQRCMPTAVRHGDRCFIFDKFQNGSIKLQLGIRNIKKSEVSLRYIGVRN
jgi:hypothetical protein